MLSELKDTVIPSCSNETQYPGYFVLHIFYQLVVMNVADTLRFQAKYLEPLIHGEVIEVASVLNSGEIIHCPIAPEVLLVAAQDDVIGMTD